MHDRHQFRKFRVSTKDRFVSILGGGELPNPSGPAWYRSRGNFFILLMIFIFAVLMVVVKSFVIVQDASLDNQQNEAGYSQPLDSTDEEEMDIEEAKRIFRGAQKPN